MADELPQQVQQDIQQLQSLNAQLQAAAQQRQQMELILSETERALEALGDLADDAPVYRNVGALLVREEGKAKAQERLSDDKETLELRLKRLRQQEEVVRTSFQQLQTKIQKALGA